MHKGQGSGLRDSRAVLDERAERVNAYLDVFKVLEEVNTKMKET